MKNEELKFKIWNGIIRDLKDKHVKFICVKRYGARRNESENKEMKKFNGKNHLYNQHKRGKKDDYIKSLKEKNEELTKALEFAMTLIPKDKLPNGISYPSYRWLINKARKNEYVEPHMIGTEV